MGSSRQGADSAVDEQQRSLRLAKKQNKQVRDFWYHLMVYVFVCGLLVVVDLRGGQTGQTGQPVLGLDWAFWVILFWGLGVIGHAISVYLSDDRAEQRYAERHPESGPQPGR